MTEARPKPLVGAIWGLLLGLVIMALLTVLGILPPDRLPLLGIVAVSMLAVSALLTQRMALAKKRFISVMVISALLAGVALTGVPEITRGGSLADGCVATATSSLETQAVSPTDTTAVDPFRVTPTDTVAWTTSTGGAVEQARGELSVMIAGFAIPVHSAVFNEAPELTEWSGEFSVENQLNRVKDRSGILVTGTHHLSATLDSDTGECTGDAYIRIEPAHAFDGVLLIVLWTLLALLLIAIIVLAVVVRRSIRDSDATLAMVGTSAIAGSTSTTPPQAPRRSSAPEAKSARSADPVAPASHDEQRRDEPRAESRGSGSRQSAERTRNSAGSDTTAAAPADGGSTVDEASAYEEAEVATEGTAPDDDASVDHDDALSRSPYVASDGPDEQSSADDATPLEEREAQQGEPVPDEEQAWLQADTPSEDVSRGGDGNGDGNGNGDDEPAPQR